jgi:hypothetical protein
MVPAVLLLCLLGACRGDADRSPLKLAGDILPGLRRKFSVHLFYPDKVVVSALTPKLIPTLEQLLDALPKALEDSKAAFFAKLY